MLFGSSVFVGRASLCSDLAPPLCYGIPRHECQQNSFPVLNSFLGKFPTIPCLVNISLIAKILQAEEGKGTVCRLPLNPPVVNDVFTLSAVAAAQEGVHSPCL